MRGAVVVLVLALVGCGDDNIGEWPRDGARLKQQWIVGDDGSKSPNGELQDSQLSTGCNFNQWSDGTWRCAPYSGVVAYADAACQQPLVLGGTPGGYATELLPTYLIGRVFRVGPALATTTWYSTSTTGCVGPYTADGLYATDGELDPNEFAGVRVENAEGDGRLRNVDFVSDDGFRMNKETRDTALGVACIPEIGQCAPEATYQVEYLDAACTQAVAVVYLYPGQAPNAYLAEPDPMCPSRVTYHALGPAVSTTSIYALAGTTCSPQALSQGYELHAIGAQVSPAAMTTAIAGAPGQRLQQTYYAGEGIAVLTGELMDTRIGSPCAWQPAADGMTRCLPDSLSIEHYYSDASCTTSIPVAIRAHDACAPASTIQFASTAANGGEEVLTISGPHTAPLYENTGSSCDVVTGYDAFDAFDVVDPISFVAGTAVFDP